MADDSMDYLEVGQIERREPPCVRLHREQIFERYPESAHGQGRSGDQCCMCRAQPPRQEPELFDVSSAERGRLAGGQGARTPGSSPVSP